MPPTISRQLRDEGLSVHEAGHAVSGIVLGLPVDRVWMGADEGACHLREMRLSSPEEEARKLAIFYQAGQWAQYSFRRITTIRECCQTDDQQYAEMLEELFQGQSYESQRRIVDDIAESVFDLVEEHKQSIMRVAEALRNAPSRAL